MNNCSDFCRTTCYNFKGYAGGCCNIEERDWIIGPIRDHMEVLKNIQKLYPELGITWNDCFINYEEGSKLFPNKSTWTNPDNYPCMRIDMNSQRKGCVFYNDILGFCQIYSVRSETCANYKCEYLKEHLKKVNGDS